MGSATEDESVWNRKVNTIPLRTISGALPVKNSDSQKNIACSEGLNYSKVLWGNYKNFGD